MTKDFDFQADVEIDEMALDWEWLRHAALVRRYCEYAAQAERASDLAHLALDVERASLDQEIRGDPEAFGITKFTEGAVSSAITINNRYQTASRRHIDAKHEAKLAQAAVRAIDKKGTALEKLVKLHELGYFAGPRVPRNLTEEKAKRDRSANQKIAMRRRG